MIQEKTDGIIDQNCNNKTHLGKLWTGLINWLYIGNCEWRLKYSMGFGAYFKKQCCQTEKDKATKLFESWSGKDKKPGLF